MASSRPIYRSVFESFSNTKGVLVNEKSLFCKEIAPLGTLIIHVLGEGVNPMGGMPGVGGVLGSEGDWKLWIGPREYWVLCTPDKRQHYLELSVREEDYYCVDASSGYGVLALNGSGVSKFFRRLLDYPYEELTPGRCVATIAGVAPVVVFRGSDLQTLFLVVRSSFAAYFYELIVNRSQFL